MAIGSKGLTPADLDGMDNERLSEELSKAKAELFNLRFASATGQNTTIALPLMRS